MLPPLITPIRFTGLLKLPLHLITNKNRTEVQDTGDPGLPTTCFCKHTSYDYEGVRVILLRVTYY